MAKGGEKSPSLSHEEDIEKGVHRNDDSDDESVFSDAENRSWHSAYNSHCAGSSIDEFRLSCASDSDVPGIPESRRNSCISDCSFEVDLENGVPEVDVNTTTKPDKDCRICHLSLDGTPESGIPIELGCSCKHDLAAAHKQCAETWFKIKGNKICEICGSMAKNVVCVTETETLDQLNETANATPAPPSETRSFWHGHRFLNFLLACMVFAFIISWLFHFNVPG